MMDWKLGRKEERKWKPVGENLKAVDQGKKSDI